MPTVVSLSRKLTAVDEFEVTAGKSDIIGLATGD